MDRARAARSATKRRIATVDFDRRPSFQFPFALPDGAPPPAPCIRQMVQPFTAGLLQVRILPLMLAEQRGASCNLVCFASPTAARSKFFGVFDMRFTPLFAACIFLAEPVLAGPDQTTQHLIGDSASMLDFGILRIDLLLQKDNLGFANYDWDANRITVQALLFERPPTTSETENDPEKWCAEWVSRVRLTGGINTKTGEPFGKSSFFASRFGHEGFSRNSEPDDLLQQIDKLINLECYAAVDDKSVTVTAPLVGTGYMVAK